MRHQIFPRPLRAMVAITVLSLSAMFVAAQDSITSQATATAGTAAPAPTSQAAPQLSEGVTQVLKLSRARVNDDTIVAFINNSGRDYRLSASEIVYLHEQGMSDRTINAMLDQRMKMRAAAAQSASPNPSATNVPAAAQPITAYVQTAPTYVPPSAVYVVPSTWPGYPYYGPYPYYGGYYGFGYPSLSFSFGFGSYHGSSHQGGSYHGGGYHRGGSQGGGNHGGGSQGGGSQGRGRR